MMCMYDLLFPSTLPRSPQNVEGRRGEPVESVAPNTTIRDKKGVCVRSIIIGCRWSVGSLLHASRELEFRTH